MSDQETVETATVEDEAQVETETVDAPIEGEEALGDKGKKALDEMKAKWREAEKKARAAQEALNKREAEIALKDKPAEEQALEAARAEARAEATEKANERILRADLRAAATGKLADPTDAALYVDLKQFTVSEDGDTDIEALNDAIDELLTRKPHLAAVKPNRFDGDADQGAKGKDSKPAQVTAGELENMTTAEVNKARREGRLNKVLGIN
jgi:hypothetical protein